MQKSAIYARYSTAEQKDTSIEDQVRRARQKAESLGYTVPDELVFSDAIITGTAKGLAKRAGYEKLLRAWDRKEFAALVVDEVSRLAREPVSLASLQVRVETTRVRLVSTDGIDSATPGWQLQFGFCGVIASHYVRETGHRVIRAMVGQLERGYMVAAAPFGYSQLRETEDGTIWLIDETNAVYVREIFKRRRQGASLAAIAKWLNEQGVPTPRKSKKSVTRYWRPGTIHQMVHNPIYRGLFVWNGSPFSKAKEKRGEATLATADYPRPALRIVDDDTWFYCNRTGKESFVRGGGKHIFAGLVRCGECESTLTVATGGSSPSLYCAQCQQAASVGVAGRMGSYVSTKGLQEVLVHALEHLFTGEVELVFRQRLKARLEGGAEERILKLKGNISKVESKLKFLLRMLSSADTTDDVAETEYRLVLAEKRTAVAELERLQDACASRDKVSIERQLEVNPKVLLPSLFSADIEAERARMALKHVFPSIVFLGKRDKFCSEFAIECAPGVLLAELSETRVIDPEVARMKFSVTGGSARPSRWVVRELV
jgi:site-specific DNA recombinase